MNLDIKDGEEIKVKKEINNNSKKEKLQILKEIELNFSERDRKGQYRGILNGKTLFRERSEEEYNKRIKDIKDFFEEGEIVTEKTSGLPFKIKKENYIDIILYNELDQNVNKKEDNKISIEKFNINSKYLESPIGKAKYVSSYYTLNKNKYLKIKRNLSQKDKLIYKTFKSLLTLDFRFAQDGYFPAIVKSYIAIPGRNEKTKDSNFGVVKRLKTNNRRWNS